MKTEIIKVAGGWRVISGKFKSGTIRNYELVEKIYQFYLEQEKKSSK